MTMPKKIDYKALYKEQLRLNKELKLEGRCAVTYACYNCRNNILGHKAVLAACKECKIETFRELVRE